MVKGKVIINNEIGLHARPASIFVQETNKFQAKVTLIKDGYEYDGKSIMSVLTMGAYKGAEIEIICEGEDEKVALESIIEFVEEELKSY